MTPEQVTELVERLNSTERTAHDARALMRDAASALSLLAQERDAANERAMTVFEAKNHWADRARAAEEALRKIAFAPEGRSGPDLTECIRIARAALKDQDGHLPAPVETPARGHSDPLSRLADQHGEISEAPSTRGSSRMTHAPTYEGEEAG